MIYVASPYSSLLPELVEQRYYSACHFIDLLIDKGFVAFSPIVYCHPIAGRLGRATTAAEWMRFNMSMLRHAEALYLLQLPGWEQSKGVKIELNVCKMLDIPVVNYSKDFKLLDEHWVNHLVEQF